MCVIMCNNTRLKGVLLKLLFKVGKSGHSTQEKKWKSFGKERNDNQQKA